MWVSYLVEMMVVSLEKYLAANKDKEVVGRTADLRVDLTACMMAAVKAE